MLTIPLLLLVDSKEQEAERSRKAFQKANVLNPVRVLRSGEEALVYLEGAGPYANREDFPVPELIFLDLSMPGINGFDVLKWLKRQPGLSRAKIVALTASSDARDVSLAFELGADSVLVKPIDFEGFARFADAIQGAWVWFSEKPTSNAA
jgi:CheY-like chemotaxis protein